MLSMKRKDLIAITDILSINKKARERNVAVDLFRLLYSLVIMTGHLVVVGVSSPFPFEPVGILVEFFLFLTGYFTCLSFKNKTSEPMDYYTNGLKYTIRKFKTFFPYLVVSVCASYLSRIVPNLRNGLSYCLTEAFQMLSEMFLLNYAFVEVSQRVGALYYLAALLIVLPVYCLLCQIKNKSIKLTIAVYLMLFYYHDMNLAVTASYPQVLIRVFTGLCGGMVIYYITEIIQSQKRIIKSFVGIILVALPLVLSGLQTLNRRIALICEFGGLIILLSDSGFYKRNWVTDYAAKLSMIIFILHWTVADIINNYIRPDHLKFRIILYYFITIAMSVFLSFVFDKTIYQEGSTR